jgi:hypothetical protein
MSFDEMDNGCEKQQYYVSDEIVCPTEDYDLPVIQCDLCANQSLNSTVSYIAQKCKYVCHVCMKREKLICESQTQ